MLLASSKLAIPEVIDEHIPMPCTQDIRVIVLKPTLESLAISYQENQLADLEL